MSWWKSLFSSNSTIEKTTDAIINAGDKMWYTEEEKADNKMAYGKFLPTLLKAYEPFKIAQRILAIWFSFLFGIAFLTGLGMFVFNAIAKYQALKNGVPAKEIAILDIQPLLDLCISFSLPTIVMIILAWYFGGGFIESMGKIKKDK